MHSKKRFCQISVFFFFLIVLFPSYVLISPAYWKTVTQNPTFFLATIIIFLLPIPIFIRNLKYNNPFFYLPFTCSFLLTNLSLNLDHFLRNYLLLIGFIITIFGLLRTKRPFIFLEIQLYLTTFFIDFFEVKFFWRTLLIILCYNFIDFNKIFRLVSLSYK
jgi:hypothetical protein